MRPCAVTGCHETDLTILSHRFPRNPNLAAKWAESLGCNTHDLSDLSHCYVVCSRHFEESHYRNPISRCLNFTAVPTLHPIRSRAASLKHDDVDPTTEQGTEVMVAYDDESNDVLHYRIGDEEEMVHLDNVEDINHINMLPSAIEEEDVATWTNPIEESVDEDSSDIFVVTGEKLVDQFLFEKDSDSKDDLVQLVCMEEDYADDTPPEDDVTQSVFDNDASNLACSTETTDIIDEQVGVPNKYSNMTREELISRLIAQEEIIQEQEKRIKSFEEAQEKLLKSMDAFKNIMGSI